jgi:hypothetical protein
VRALSFWTVVLAMAAGTAGCLDLVAAHVPDNLLEGSGGNGWARNDSGSQTEPVSSQGGFVKTQSLVYDQLDANAGYPGTLTVTTVRTLLRPSEDKLRGLIQDTVREQAQAKGIDVTSGPLQGTRVVAAGATAFWFLYNGTVTSGGFFSQSAQVKLYGEVFQCAAHKTDVVTVGLAQTTDVHSLGGIPIPSDPDYRTWQAIVEDPGGTIEGYRGSTGLAYNVVC